MSPWVANIQYLEDVYSEATCHRTVEHPWLVTKNSQNCRWQHFLSQSDY